jgi:hypothetical protein
MPKFSRSDYEHLLYTLPPPHHLHRHPDIKRNRQPAPGISFTVPNLPTLIEACIKLGKGERD